MLQKRNQVNKFINFTYSVQQYGIISGN